MYRGVPDRVPRRRARTRFRYGRDSNGYRIRDFARVAWAAGGRADEFRRPAGEEYLGFCSTGTLTCAILSDIVRVIDTRRLRIPHRQECLCHFFRTRSKSWQRLLQEQRKRRFESTVAWLRRRRPNMPTLTSLPPTPSGLIRPR